MTEFIECPAAGCDVPCAIEDRYLAPGSPEPVEMVRGRCVAGHWFHQAADGVGL